MKEEIIVTESTFEPPQRVEWKGVPVITSVQLAEFYDCTVTQIKQNFNNNKFRFVEGKHYFKLEGENILKFRSLVDEIYLLQISKFTPTLYLWTKRGCARHAKMLTTDKAWEVFELLEDNYFDVVKKNADNPVADNLTIKEKVDYLLKAASKSHDENQRTAFLNGVAELLGVETAPPSFFMNDNPAPPSSQCKYKLSREQISVINRLYNRGGTTIRELAEIYGVSRETIRVAIKRK